MKADIGEPAVKEHKFFFRVGGGGKTVCFEGNQKYALKTSQ
jgi:hypothetical protein